MLLKKSNWICTVVIGSASALALASSLPSCSPSCEELANCSDYVPPAGGSSGDGGEAGVPDPGTAGTQNQAGKGGDGGSGGSSLGGAGSGGVSGGESGAGIAGEAGSPPVKPCVDGCEGTTPICDESTNTCVECLGPPDCAGGTKKACDVSSHTCVECVDAPDCTGPNKHCEPTTQTCVQCLAPADCPEAATARCDANACVKCASNDDCAHITGKGVCDTKAGECVQCTGKDYAACGMDAGTPLVCDTLKRTCTTNKEHAGDLCKPCVSDAHCKLGEMCALQKYGGKDVGFFCFWKQGETVNGAPSDCFMTGHPYGGTAPNTVSVDGQTADICSLRSSSCVAVAQFSTKNCKPNAAPDDALCGFSPPGDAKCDQVGASANYRCTMTCGSNEDCPGAFVCNMSTFVCDI